MTDDPLSSWRSGWLGALGQEPVERPEPTRDRWGRYLLRPTPDRRDVVAHVRTTTITGGIGDKTALMNWKAAKAARGTALRPGLAAQLVSLPEPDHRDPKIDKQRRAAINKIVEAALEAAGANDAREHGSGLHRMGERIASGALDPGQVPEDWRARIELAFATEQRYGLEVESDGIEVITSAERATTGGSVLVAGTTDRIYRVTRPIETPFGVLVPGDRVIGDWKTGSVEWAEVEHAAQLHAYASAQWVHRHRDGEWVPEPMPRVSQHVGLILHLPSTSDEPRCAIHAVDLEKGREVFAVALAARQLSKRSGLAGPIELIEKTGEAMWINQIDACTTGPELATVGRLIATRGEGTDRLRRAFKRRQYEIADILAKEK